MPFNPRTLRACIKAVGFQPVRLLTRNVDVPETLAKWRWCGQPEKPVGAFLATRSFRRPIERSPWLRWLKVGANAILRLSRLGETIEVLAVKQEEASKSKSCSVDLRAGGGRLRQMRHLG